MEELPAGIRRVTLPLPTRPGHVHSYLVPGSDGWMVVDTGLGLPDAKERWAAELAALDGEVTRIFVTHFHPDHVGAARDLAELTGAEVLQGALDLEQCRRVWESDDWGDVLVDWFGRNGVPPDVTQELIGQGSSYRPFIRHVPDASTVEPGDTIDGWEVVAAPGHADGQLVLLRDGVLLAADHILRPISPTVGLWPASRPDPLGDYLGALGRVVELAPAAALPGHGEVVWDPVERARELIDHHRKRLDVTQSALSVDQPRSGYEISFPLFGRELKPSARRFAVAETLSHLERLVADGRGERHEASGTVSYTALQ